MTNDKCRSYDLAKSKLRHKSRSYDIRTYISYLQSRSWGIKIVATTFLIIFIFMWRLRAGVPYKTKQNNQKKNKKTTTTTTKKKKKKRQALQKSRSIIAFGN